MVVDVTKNYLEKHAKKDRNPIATFCCCGHDDPDGKEQIFCKCSCMIKVFEPMDCLNLKCPNGHSDPCWIETHGVDLTGR